MLAFIKKYKAFIIGFIITWVLILILSAKGVILIDKDDILTNILGFLFYWILISMTIYKLPYFKENIKIVYRIIALIVFLIIVLILDANSGTPDNPLVILFLIVFYLSSVYILTPKFFKKYRWIILGVYAFAFGVFLYYRLFSGSFENYTSRKEDILLLFIIPAPIFFFLWVYEQWKWVKGLQAEKITAELSLLKTQVNPHFFFNTLNNLYALTIKNSKQAPEVILKLSEMMRYTIYEGKKDTVPLKEEIIYLENYIELHKIRYHKSVMIQFEHTIVENDTIAPLLFIILLENALKHGVESLTENAYVKMNLRSDDKEIHFSIENNFDPKEVNPEKGIGLENLKHRLSLIYPKNHKLLIIEKENTFTVDLKITKND
ncbi:GHKL domain-containing protein [Flavobacteriaceae bacterium AU392]|nr:GHKL domain-containing protein [Flavobacteriaceae bacterium]RKM82751.1 GHKL domain-containing protein [Flavobacteriaceae bacterium AU392]